MRQSFGCRGIPHPRRSASESTGYSPPQASPIADKSRGGGWMAPGGYLVFYGSPAEALRHFRVQNFGDIYALLETPEDCQRWAATFLDSSAYRVNVGERLHSGPADGG